MQAKELILDNSSEGKVIKELSKGLPDRWVSIFAATLVVEAVDLGDLPRFVVSSQDCYPIFMTNFQGD